ncbi:MAG: efflux RND transporter permease subunit [Alphaproteobacteria bacterium]|nr:efflux RND transporter permease subunit [Alphaproteobacteria bacterium]
MKNIINIAISNTRTVITALILLIIAGGITFNSLPKESDPDVHIPIIYVSMILSGISPEDSETLLLRPMEQKLRAVEGIKEMRSTAYQGGGNVILEFDAGFDSEKALRDVRQKSEEAKPDLPDEAEEPVVEEVNLSLLPILVVSVAGDAPYRTLVSLSKKLRDKIERIDSVLKVEISGDREEEVDIIVDPLLLESYGLDANDIFNLIGRSNRLVTAGNLETGQGSFAIKVPGLFKNAEDILDMPLKINGDAVVKVRDVATIRSTYKDAQSYARMNGKTTIGLEVSKRSGQNVIETIDKVRAVVDEEKQYWPPTVQVSYSSDESVEIKRMLVDLENSLLIAVILVMIVIIGSLGLRSGLLVGTAIPGSFLIGILVLALQGLTLNIVVLFSLILAVGMLVDGAIVLVEYADRKMVEGYGKMEAYRLAAHAMFWPIFGSTATVIAAFLPLLFWPGTVGQFMKFLPLTLVATLGASFLMAMFFGPALGSVFGKTIGAEEIAKMKILDSGSITDLKNLRGFTGWYVRVLDRALNNPIKVLLVAFVVLIGAWVAYSKFGNGVEFFPNIEPDRASLQIRARGNLSLDEKDILVREVEKQVFAVQEQGHEFNAIYTVTRGGNPAMRRDIAEDVIGIIRLEFADWQKRRKAVDILEELRQKTAHLAGIIVEPSEQKQGPRSGKDIDITLSSRFAELLPPAVVQLRQKLESMSGLQDIEDTRSVPGIEWEISVDRSEAAKFSTDITSIGNAIQFVTRGLKFSTYRPEDSDDEVDIVARFPEEFRTIKQLDNIRVGENNSVPISNFIKRDAKPKVGVIERLDGERILHVKSNVQPGVLINDKVKEIQSWISQANFDSRINIQFKGDDEEQNKSQKFLTGAFMAALALIGMLLLAQFNSFYNTLLILSAVIMSTIGVMIGLLIINQPFGIVMSGIGVIALAGIIVSNNIILIDTFEHIRHETGSVKEAIIRTGAQRLRPVLLTKITAILGLLPLVIGLNIDIFTREISIGAPATQWWTQLSSAIVFGLSFGSILTLIVTPCSLMLKFIVRDYAKKIFRR